MSSRLRSAICCRTWRSFWSRGCTFPSLWKQPIRRRGMCFQPAFHGHSPARCLLWKLSQRGNKTLVPVAFDGVDQHIADPLFEPQFGAAPRQRPQQGNLATRRRGKCRPSPPQGVGVARLPSTLACAALTLDPSAKLRNSVDLVADGAYQSSSLSASSVPSCSRRSAPSCDQRTSCSTTSPGTMT